jgi:hypothetical protein
MNSVEDFEQVLTLDRRLAEFDWSPAVEGASSTQQLLDELLGRFEDDGSFQTHGHTPEFCLDSED